MPNQSTNTPVVSVVVPSYNHAPYLRRRLDSILGQTFQDFELVILEDASTDKSRQIIETYLPHPKIKLIQNTVNSGSVFRQWDKGFALAQGKYIWTAESDDWADPHLLERLVGILEKNPAIGLAYCQSQIVNPGGQIIGDALGWTEEFAPGRWQKDYINNGRDEIRRFLTNRNTIPNASAVLVRKCVLDAIGPIDTDFRLCGDWMLWIRLLEKADVAFCAESLNYWRINTSNVRQDNGTLEWLEGERILRHAAAAVGLSPAETTEILLAFLRKCWQWQRESLAQQHCQPTIFKRISAAGKKILRSLLT